MKRILLLLPLVSLILLRPGPGLARQADGDELTPAYAALSGQPPAASGTSIPRAPSTTSGSSCSTSA